MPNIKITILLIVCSYILLSCNSHSGQAPYSLNRNWSYAPLKIKYNVPADWHLISEQEYKKIKRTTRDSKFLLGIKMNKSFLYLSDYDLIADNCNNTQFVNNMRDTLEKTSLWSKNYPEITAQLKPAIQKKIGSYSFTILENDYFFKSNHQLMMSTLFYIGFTINSHVLLGFSNIHNLNELNEVESGFCYNGDTSSVNDLFFKNNK